MEITVLIEPLVEGNRCRATSLSLPGFVSEGASREEALARVRQLILEQLAHAEIARIEVQLPGKAHPWMAFAGTWKDRPDLAEFEQNIREYRRQIDGDPDRP
jgi:predicted RNase H-like HicB family nuclease